MLRTYLDGCTDGPLLLDCAGSSLDRFDVVRILRRLARTARIPDPTR